MYDICIFLCTCVLWKVPSSVAHDLLCLYTTCLAPIQVAVSSNQRTSCWGPQVQEERWSWGPGQPVLAALNTLSHIQTPITCRIACSQSFKPFKLTRTSNRSFGLAALTMTVLYKDFQGFNGSSRDEWPGCHCSSDVRPRWHLQSSALPYP